MKKSVLLLETITDESLALLTEHVNIVKGYENNVLVPFEEIQGIITRGKGQVDRALMDACPNLAVVARCGVGLDNIDVAVATERGVKVVNTPGVNGRTVAEHTLSLMLMVVRDLCQSVEQVKQNNWNWRNEYAGDELGGKTLGILGMGNIGKRVAHLANAFGMNVVYWSRTEQPDLPYTYLPMEEVLRQADLLSLHLPLEPGSAPLIGVAELALMKPMSYLINTARGALIDHNGLLRALDSGALAGFAADVLPELTTEVRANLLAMPQVLVTPHAASLTSTTYKQMCLLAVNKVIHILRGGL